VTKIDLQAIRGRAAAALPGPWYWGGNVETQTIRLTALQGRNGRRGVYEVMDFVRWGMQKAQPRFLNLIEGGHWMVPAKNIPIFEVCPEATSFDDPRVYRGDLIGLRHPDAEFIAHSRQDVEDLLAYIDELEAKLHAQEPLVSYALNAAGMKSPFTPAGVGAHRAVAEYERRRDREVSS
jgi:hypothetical protein